MMTVLYIIIGIVALFFLMQFSMVRMAKKTKGLKLSGLSGQLKNLENKGSKGLVYFFSPSCRACKAQTPMIKSLQKKHKYIYDVDISRDMNTAKVFGVKATPTIVVVKDGVVNDVLLGVKQTEALEKLVAW